MSEMRGAPLLHVGYHKTGTKWLQRFVFDSADLGFAAPVERGTDVGVRLINPHPLDFDADDARAWFDRRLASVDDRLVPAISHERISGHPYSGGYDSRELAERMAAVFPDARILFTVREQASAIRSLYKQYVRVGGAARLQAFLHPPAMGRTQIPAFSFHHFEYDRLVRLYRRLFGPDRVLVLPFERFRREPEAFVHAITDFAGATAGQGALEALPFRRTLNASDPALAVAARRRANALLVRSRMHPMARWHRPGWSIALGRLAARVARRLPAAWNDRVERRLREEVVAIVGDRYRDSNRRLAEQVGLDLEAEGYPV